MVNKSERDNGTKMWLSADKQRGLLQLVRDADGMMHLHSVPATWVDRHETQGDSPGNYEVPYSFDAEGPSEPSQKTLQLALPVDAVGGALSCVFQLSKNARASSVTRETRKYGDPRDTFFVDFAAFSIRPRARLPFIQLYGVGRNTAVGRLGRLPGGAWRPGPGQLVGRGRARGRGASGKGRGEPRCRSARAFRASFN